MKISDKLLSVKRPVSSSSPIKIVLSTQPLQSTRWNLVQTLAWFQSHLKNLYICPSRNRKASWARIVEAQINSQCVKFLLWRKWTTWMLLRIRHCISRKAGSFRTLTMSDQLSRKVASNLRPAITEMKTWRRPWNCRCKTMAWIWMTQSPKQRIREILTRDLCRARFPAVPLRKQPRRSLGTLVSRTSQWE